MVFRQGARLAVLLRRSPPPGLAGRPPGGALLPSRRGHVALMRRLRARALTRRVELGGGARRRPGAAANRVDHETFDSARLPGAPAPIAMENIVSAVESCVLNTYFPLSHF